MNAERLRAIPSAVKSADLAGKLLGVARRRSIVRTSAHGRRAPSQVTSRVGTGTTSSPAAASAAQGVRIELGEAAVRIGEADGEVTYACPRCSAVTVFAITDTPVPS